MKKQIYDEKNGLSYTLHGDYYLPDLEINEEEPAYGKYGIMLRQFHGQYQILIPGTPVLLQKLFSHYSIFPICGFFLIDF